MFHGKLTNITKVKKVLFLVLRDRGGVHSLCPSCHSQQDTGNNTYSLGLEPHNSVEKHVQSLMLTSPEKPAVKKRKIQDSNVN